jgi:hypothetical protein
MVPLPTIIQSDLNRKVHTASFMGIIPEINRLFHLDYVYFLSQMMFHLTFFPFLIAVEEYGLPSIIKLFSGIISHRMRLIATMV